MTMPFRGPDSIAYISNFRAECHHQVEIDRLNGGHGRLLNISGVETFLGRLDEASARHPELAKLAALLRGLNRSSYRALDEVINPKLPKGRKQREDFQRRLIKANTVEEREFMWRELAIANDGTK